MSALVVDRIAPNRLRILLRFAARPERVFDARVGPDLIPRRLTGPDGWSMTRCQIKPRPDGAFRYDQADASGIGFHVTGILEAVERPGRILHREVTHVPERTPESLVETRFEPERGGTRLTMTMDLPDAETLEAMRTTGMTDGMEASHARLEAAF